MSSAPFIIYCRKHNNFPLIFGCIESKCRFEKVFCNACLLENPQHEQIHRKYFVNFNAFIDILADNLNQEINVSFDNNVRNVFENEQTYLSKLLAHFRIEKEFLGNSLESVITTFIEQMLKLKKEIFDYFDLQIDNFKKNISFFKNIFSGYSPISKYFKFSNPNFLKSKLLAMKPDVAFDFINALEKSAFIEGNNLIDLNNLAKQILDYIHNPPKLPLTKIQNIREEVFLIIIKTFFKFLLINKIELKTIHKNEK